jgi:hypothetical protein
MLLVCSTTAAGAFARGSEREREKMELFKLTSKSIISLFSVYFINVLLEGTKNKSTSVWEGGSGSN